MAPSCAMEHSAMSGRISMPRRLAVSWTPMMFFPVPGYTVRRLHHPISATTSAGVPLQHDMQAVGSPV